MRRAVICLCLAALASAAASAAAAPPPAADDAAAARAALAEAERAALLADARAGGLPAALAQASVRRGQRYLAGLASGRLSIGPTVSTIYGSLTGVTGGNVTQFLGVPFAAPPVGPLRWRAPAKPANWGARNATWFGPTCPQTEANTWAIFTGTSEDCLNLNVYAPSAPAPAGGYPIMLFFYGGSFQ
jgi:para-nitrobenzyl esterase